MITECRGLQIIPATAGHIKALSFVDLDPALQQVDTDITIALMEDNLTFALMTNDSPVLVAGLIPLLPGSAMAWLMTSSLIKTYPVTAAVACRRGLHNLFRENQLHRIQIVLYRHYQAAIRFAEWLGFRREGLMKKYGPGQTDYYLYALTTE